MGEESVTHGWLEKHTELYQLATRHPFLLCIRDGSLDLDCFKLWLGQDYFFVKAFVRFVASTLIKLPKDAEEADMDIVLGGLCALQQELSWFRAEASTWGLRLDHISLHTITVEYCRFLDELADPQTEIVIALAALWAIEVVYNDSFAHCLEPGSRIPLGIESACKRWGSSDFKMYCTTLQRLADKYLLKCSAHDVREKAEGIFVKVLTTEIGFWNMSVGLPIS